MRAMRRLAIPPSDIHDVNHAKVMCSRRARKRLKRLHCGDGVVDSDCDDDRDNDMMIAIAATDQGYVESVDMFVGGGGSGGRWTSG